MSQTNDNAGKNRRLSQRRLPKGKVKVVCQKGSLSLGANVALSALDVSETGIRLLVREELPVGTEVSLTVESQNHRKALKLQGRVMWIVPAEESSAFQAGILFSKRLAYPDFLKLT